MNFNRLSVYLTLSALCAIFMLFFWSCAEPGAEYEPGQVRIEFWHSMSGEHGNLISSFANEFNALHDGVEIIPVYQGAYSSLNQKLVASIQAGNPPVITQMYETWTSLLIKADAIQPVQKFIDEDPDFQEELDDFIKIFIANNSWNDMLYTLPFNKSSYVFFVNKTHLKEQGIESIPRTWEEKVEVGKKLTRDLTGNNRIDQFGLGLRPVEATFSLYLYQNGGQYLDEDGVPQLDSPEAIEALQYIVDLVHKHNIALQETAYLSQLFGTGRISMFYGSSAGIPFVERSLRLDDGSMRFEWDAYPMPGNNTPATLFEGTNVGILKTRTPRIQQYAWEFLKFLTSKENNLRWAITTGYTPVRYSVLEEPTLIDFIEEMPAYEAVITQYDTGYYDPRVHYWSNIRPLIRSAVEKALNRTLTPEQALREAQERALIELEWW